MRISYDDEDMLRKLTEGYMKWVLKINASKTDYFLIGCGDQGLEFLTNVKRAL